MNKTKTWKTSQTISNNQIISHEKQGIKDNFVYKKIFKGDYYEGEETENKILML